MKELNPANAVAKTSAERKRIPMSVPVQKLETAEIPGYHLHWFRSAPDRIQRALNAGYEFVKPEEISLNNVSLGGNSAVSGNTDLGSQVSVIAGGIEDGTTQPSRLILMKIKLELYEEDEAIKDKRSAGVVNALSKGLVGAGEAPGEKAGDSAQRYVKRDLTKLPEMFRRKR